jgi:pyruvate dehydrogenase E2 component (dihydrolipoamide acetyltransferase)
MSNTIEVKVPDIGDFSDVEVIEVLVSEGDTISAEQSLITVESDKASMEIPSSAAGVVKSVKVKIGDKVKEGSVILTLEAAEAAQAKEAETSPSTKADSSTPSAAQPSSPAPAAGGAKRSQIVQVPDIGDSTDVEIIEIMVSVGDTVAVDQSLITLESDKASMEVPSSHAGVVKSIKVKLGDKVNKGSDILELEVGDTQSSVEKAPAGQAADTKQPESAEQPSAQPGAQDSQATAQAEPVQGASPAGRMASEPPERRSPTLAYADADVPASNLPHASPSVRKFARELGVNLASVSGSGNKNRITHDDVRRHVKQVMSSSGSVATLAPAEGGGGFSVLGWPKVDFEKFGPVQARPLSRIKKISGANLHRNWVMIPHVTNNDQADITDLEELRQTLNKENAKSGVKVTMLAFLMKAVVAALKKFPEFNASLDGDNLVLKQYYHIGFAADTPNGLVVPVIRDADRKGIMELAAETAELAAQARNGKLSPSQMQGGCFSISSLGGIGGTSFTPIINAPEVAILGVSRSSHMPVWNGSGFVPRLMLPLSLSYDHRVIDGAAAARFNAYLAELLADFRRIAL